MITGDSLNVSVTLTNPNSYSISVTLAVTSQDPSLSIVVPGTAVTLASGASTTIILNVTALSV